MEKFDVIIVGGGPAGLFAALGLADTRPEALLLEKGKASGQRLCPIRGKGGVCPPCYPCGVVSGLGGAGAFSDGKLTLSPHVGGRLVDYLGRGRTEELIKHVDRLYLRFGAEDKVYGLGEEVEAFRKRASLAELRLIPVGVRHMGTERCRRGLRAIKDYLAPRVEIRLGATVE